MTVTVNNRSESRSFWLQIELINVVQHKNGNALEFHDIGLRKFAGPGAVIDIAADSSHRGSLGEPVQNRRIANITRMNNMVRSLERLDGFSPKQSMCVRDDADEHTSAAFSKQRKCEEGDEISVVEFKTTEYGRSKKVIASEEIKQTILEIGINKCARESGFDRKNFVRKLVRGIPVKRISYSEFMRWLAAARP